MFEPKPESRPKKPSGKDWVRLPSPTEWLSEGITDQLWKHPKKDVFVISAVSVNNDVAEYHLTARPKKNSRLSWSKAKFVLKAFGLHRAVEENLTNDIVSRNFWQPVEVSKS